MKSLLLPLYDDNFQHINCSTTSSLERDFLILFSGLAGLKINWHFWINKKFHKGLNRPHVFPCKQKAGASCVGKIFGHTLYHPCVPFREQWEREATSSLPHHMKKPKLLNLD
jgi:hypothetical protein